MAVYYVRGVTAATAATADHAICALWNPAAGRRIKVVEFAVFKAGTGASSDSVKIERITARGTAGSTVTPDADNSAEADAIPDSGALLDLAAYSAQPTRATPGLYGWVAPNVAGAGIILPFPRGITIPPGAGLALTQRAATAWPISEVTFIFED
ncbi:MAG: hypothetical protein ACRD8U_21260 [Pyrinomonadaceae bacterium]